ncbi:MAG TPA: SPOR domain-containing protein [Methylococcaceae bacterium]|jgi:DedD protein|nr:SPOR domain-containing protein [Methylococcaceae bacterium]
MEQQLKQRLIGVTIIVSLIVIFVPMLFDKADQQPGTVSDGVPPIPEAFEEKAIDLPKSAADVAPKETGNSSESGYKIIPLTDEPVQKAGETAQAKALPAEGEQGFEAPVEEEQFEPVPEKPLKPVESPFDEPVKPAAKQPEKPGKAELAEQKAKESKKAKTQAVQATPPKPKPATVTPPKAVEAPVRKPEPIEQAKSGSASVKPGKASAGAPLVQAEPLQPAPPSARPGKSAPAAEPAGDLAAWVVQTGSFTAEGNARTLAEKLRQAKFAAFVEAVPGKTGSVYRVQVGPELERGRAEQMQQQIEAQLGIRGIVVPHH